MQDNLKEQVSAVINMARYKQAYAKLVDGTFSIDIWLPVVKGADGLPVEINTYVFNKRGRNALERIIDRLEWISPIAYIHCGYGISGYPYWAVCDKPEDKLLVCVHLKKPNTDCDALAEAVDNFIDRLSAKYLHLLECKSYVRKAYRNV